MSVGRLHDRYINLLLFFPWGHFISILFVGLVSRARDATRLHACDESMMKLSSLDNYRYASQSTHDLPFV